MVTIVVVEPDPAVRALLAEWLETAGYTVLPFARWPVAADVLASARALVLDLPSPRQPPSSSLADMHVRRSGLPAIGLSTSLGASLDAGSAFARSHGLAAALAKPCGRRELLAAVHAALGRRAA